MLDPATGAGTAVGAFGFVGVRGLACDPKTGTLFAADTDIEQLIAIDPATGQGTAIGPTQYFAIDGLTIITGPDCNGNGVPDFVDVARGLFTQGHQDIDGDVDLFDAAEFLSCALDPGLEPAETSCCISDFDGDEDVDLIDGGSSKSCSPGQFDLMLRGALWVCSSSADGDDDNDADVDLRDLDGVAICQTGSGNGPGNESCYSFDFDGDGGVDLLDWAASRPLSPADCSRATNRLGFQRPRSALDRTSPLPRDPSRSRNVESVPPPSSLFV